MIQDIKQAAEQIPDSSNWREAFTLSGKPAGFAFFCPRCKLGIPFEAPEQVFHCGAYEERPLIIGTAAQRKAERTHRVRFV